MPPAPPRRTPDRPRSRRTAVVAALAVLVALALSACTVTVEGEGSYANGVKPNAAPSDLKINGSGGGEIDQLAANSLDDIITYWTAEFPKAFGGKQFTPLKGGYYSYDPKGSQNVPCLSSPAEGENNAFYCPSADLIAYDRVFLGQLAKEYGPFIVTLVLAHEFGHAIQAQVGDPAEASINIETQADCYAGVFVKKAADGTTHFQVSDSDLDSVLGGYLFFRDSPGGSADEAGSHGSAFDRVIAFQEGFESGASACTSDFGSDRTFTEIPFTATEQANQGNAAYENILQIVPDELEPFWEKVLKAPSSFGDIKTTAIGAQGGTCDGKAVEDRVYYCPADQTIWYDDELMKKAYQSFGDFAVFELFSLAYADAALQATGSDLQGENRFAAEVCLTGGYAGDAFFLTQAGQQTLGGSTLSAGDLDEAIAVLIAIQSDNQVVDTEGTSGFQRVDEFRKGFELVKPGVDKITGCVS